MSDVPQSGAGEVIPVEDRRYSLRGLTPAHCRVLEASLDLYSRIVLGQFTEVLRVWEHTGPRTDAPELTVQQHREVEVYLHLVHELLTGLPRSAYHGIRNPLVPEVARTAYDIQQVLRHATSWDRNPVGGITVNYDAPLKTSKEPLPSAARDGDCERYSRA